MRVSPITALARRAFVGAAVVWSAALPVSAWAWSRAPDSPLRYASAAVYAIGSALCHQLPARSIHLWGVQMPVCARCTGIYAGAAVVSIALSIVPRFRRAALVRLKSDATRARILLVLALVPALATLVYEWTTGVMPSHALRAASGFVLGAAVAAIVLAALDNQVN